MISLPARLIHEIGTVAHTVITWEANITPCHPGHTYHRAAKEVGRSSIIIDNFVGAEAYERQDPADLPTVCERCGTPVPPDARVGLARGRIYNTASEKPEPGDLFWVDWYDCKERGRCVYGWTNCDGRHLFAVLPNGHHWDIDARANNCTLPHDTTHRCWIRHGEPPHTHVDKNGHTCQAGAGSIVAGNYHGFLHEGIFVAC